MLNNRIVFLVLALILSTELFASISRDFFRNPNIFPPQLNSSGSAMLIKKADAGSYRLVVMNTKTKKEYEVTSLSQRSRFTITDIQWIDDNTFSYHKYHSHRGVKLFVYDLSKDFEITNRVMLENTLVFHSLARQEDRFIAARYKYRQAELFRINLKNSDLDGQFRSKKKINKGRLKEGEWLLGSSGRPNVNWGQNDGKNKVYVRKTRKSGWKLIWDNSIETTFIPIKYIEDERTLIVVSDKDDGYRKLYQFDVDKEEFKGVLYQRKSTDLKGVITDFYDEKIIGYTYVQGGEIKQVYLEDLGSIEASDEGKASKSYITGYNENKDKIIYLTGSIDEPGQFFLFDRSLGEKIELGKVRPWLDKYKLGRSSVIRSLSSDGLAIESYLTVPTDSQAKKFPLLVIPHGGPLGVQDTRHFSSEIHYFVRKGFAVLTPNYRGSAGYGKKFLNSGKQQWGRLIEDDIESAVEEVAKLDNIDINKTCIFGISYGGYSALISAIRRPDLYKCAISYAGVTDISLLFSQSDKAKDKESRKMLIDILGNPDESLETLKQYSPIYRLEDLKIPIFIAQGGRDRIVDEEHFFRMRYLMNKLDMPYKHRYFQNEVHGFMNLGNKINFFNEVSTFVKRHTQ